MKRFSIFLIAALGVANVSSVYITTCHNDNECGTVCGTKGPNTVGPSEGLFGTKCECQNGKPPAYLCNKEGKNVYVCSDNQAPRCTVHCNMKVCIEKNGRKSTGVIRSACPKHHPQNAHDCCNHGGSYCTCVFHDTLDTNYQVFSELGGSNGDAKAWLGSCDSHHGLKVGSIQAELYLQLVKPELCSAVMSDGYHQRNYPEQYHNHHQHFHELLDQAYSNHFQQ
ncbi:UNKNOWN [Stylonychia lemnae]|uniref:Uncharacterized protein n=1 Tax=Stylonychia lemnae TaxID=5949 RepID=A0A078AW94_STYLE|nr:UNKNOWN [Stylonychia lemnae]|eukprot:CDW86740.1 UNKNOWN [Stylonychia lemnae]